LVGLIGRPAGIAGELPEELGVTIPCRDFFVDCAEVLAREQSDRLQ
jgi:hypothetical protein